MFSKTIKCPHCDREYFPGEIFLPKYFLGQPTNVEKDIEGKIIWDEGIKQDLEEEYVCDKCNQSFKVVANIEYEVKENINDINKDYISKKYSDRIQLKEF